MSNEIQRVQYLDRQILRAADLKAEQAYHRGLRWRNNRALHLDGIVAGLTIEPFSNTVIVNPGMALDAWGREVFLTQAVTIDERHLPPGAKDGTYSVVLRYAQQPPTASSSPSECDTASTNRLTEEGAISLVPPGLPSSAPEQFFLEPPDNPQRSAPVLLGAVSVGKTQGGRRSFTPADPQPVLKYVGLRGQRLFPPDYKEPATGKPEPKDLMTLRNHAPTEAPQGLSVLSDLHARRDVIIGENFSIEPTSPKPEPELGADYPQTPGHLKIAGDAFLRGRFYILKRDKDDKVLEEWIAIHKWLADLQKRTEDLQKANSELLNTLNTVKSQFGRPIPEITQFPNYEVTISDLSPSDPSTQAVTIAVPAPNMPTINRTSAIVTVTRTEPGSVPPQGQNFVFEKRGVSALNFSSRPTAAGMAELTINFRVGRTWKDPNDPTRFRCELKKVVLSALVVLHPPNPITPGP